VTVALKRCCDVEGQVAELAAVAPSGALVVLRPQLQEALAKQQEGWARETHRQQQTAAAMLEQLEQLQQWRLQHQQHIGRREKVSAGLMGGGWGSDVGCSIHGNQHKVALPPIRRKLSHPP
jgi:hypothetical protein